MPTLHIKGNQITLTQALKAAGLAESGGRARHLVRQGEASVNGLTVTQPGRKLALGDRFGVKGSEEWTLGHATGD
jgi:ribosome-associated protein YbcJ (S4-like RNA binding protein)